MATLEKFEIRELPEFVVIGKPLEIPMPMPPDNPIPAWWGKCFGDGTFETLERYRDFILEDSYVGWMGDWAGKRSFLYLCGMMMKPGCPVPEGYVARAVAAGSVAIGWVKSADESELFQSAHPLTEKALEAEGYSAKDATWSMELYNCPRFTTPAGDGSKILDYYLPCGK